VRTLTHSVRTNFRVDRRYAAAVAVIAVIYLAAAKLGLSFAFSTKQISAVWPPSGLALVTMLILGYRYWPGIFLGAMLANATTNEPLLVAAGIAVGNTLEALAGAYFLRTVAQFKNVFAKPRDAGFFALAGAISAPIAALFGTACLAAGGLIAWSGLPQAALLWWQGDLMGIVLFGPFLLAYLNPHAFDILRGRLIEGGVILAAAFGLSIAVFTSHSPSALAFPYLLFPVAMLAAIRLTQLGVVTTSMVVAVVAVWATLNKLGPFAVTGQIEEGLVLLQVFVTVLSATSLMLAMAITERLSAEAELRQRTGQLAKMDEELKEANKRVTNILADILDERSPRRGKGNGHG